MHNNIFNHFWYAANHCESNNGMMELSEFKNIIYDFYRERGRHSLPWRTTENPCHILVSEFMLQQTQVDRVVDKYTAFIQSFPDFYSLAHASLQMILSAWQGLGYNRRALFLQRTAQRVESEFHGTLPSNPAVLATFPGIGHATACSIAAFAFNRPVVFIETNIRSVFIHFFFQDTENVRDADILPLVETTLDAVNPREWYYALMDYGVMLKKTRVNPARSSAHYVKQTRFEGSNRQVRGMILRALTARSGMTTDEIASTINRPVETVAHLLSVLMNEQFIAKDSSGRYTIT